MRALIVALVLLSVSCAAEASQIIVIVDGDVEVIEATRSIQVEVYGGSRQDQLQTAATSGQTPLLNHSLEVDRTAAEHWGTTRIALAPLGDDASRLYRVQVTAWSEGNRGGDVVASTYVISGYVEGQTRVLRLFLRSVCTGVECPPERVCGPDAACIDPFVDPEDLPTPSDAGTDADRRDADSGDDARADSPMDATNDGGPDAPADVGSGDAVRGCEGDPECDDGFECTADRCIGGRCESSPGGCDPLTGPACGRFVCDPDRANDCDRVDPTMGLRCSGGATCTADGRCFGDVACTEPDACLRADCDGEVCGPGGRCSAGTCQFCDSCGPGCDGVACGAMGEICGAGECLAGCDDCTASGCVDGSICNELGGPYRCYDGRCCMRGEPGCP